jgi:glycosyltransferase involved in cell wall biosynthesis
MTNIIILHNGNGRPYFQAVEYFAKLNNYQVIYRETNFIKSLIKILLNKKCVTCNLKMILNNFLFFLKVPFIKDKIIIYGTAPYDFRFLWYSILRYNNNFIYHTSHHKWGEDNSSVFLYGIFTHIIKLFWVKILKSNNIKIVAVTKESKNTLEKNFKLSSKVYQIYHSIDLNKFKIQNKRDNKKLKILFVGRLVYEKGLDILVEVINKVDRNKFDFTIVGDGNYKDKISSVFEKDNVTYLGWINDKDEMASIFKEHDVLLNPSIRYKDWEELFGIVNIEAMASGLIVIASDHIGPREIINNGENGILVPEKNSQLIIKELNNLFIDHEYKNYLSKSACKNVERFSEARICMLWKKVIEKEN